MSGPADGRSDRAEGAGRVPPFAANTWIWVSPLTDRVLGPLAARVASLGFDLIELPLEDPGDLDASRVADTLAEVALGATVGAAMSDGRSLVAADRAVVAGTQAYLRACVDFAHRIGARVVGGALYAPVGERWRMDPDERSRCYDRLAAGLRPVSEYAGEHGVCLAVEPLNRFETSVLNTVSQALDVLARVDSPACGLLADTFHMNIEEESIGSALREAGERLVHLQVCANDRGSPGRDHLDWKEIKQALGALRYRGALSIESFSPEFPSFADAVSIWRPLAPSQDDLAADGLRFLRALFSS